MAIPNEKIFYFSYITDVANVESILEFGILSHNRSRTIEHISVANESVQDRRRLKTLPSGRPLHDYANVYVYCRNAMMYDVRKRPTICVLEVSKRILEIAGACYSDRNAAVADARFFPCTRNLDELDPQIVYARRWVDDQGVVDEDKKAAMQAEILVPDSISPEFLRSVVFRSQDDAWHFQQRYNANIAVKVDAKRFFE